MMQFDVISDLVVSWALRRGESIGVKRNDGIDDHLAAALDHLGRLVWAKLQQNSAWVKMDAELVHGQDASPLTKHRVQAAIEAAARTDRAFLYHLHEAAEEVQMLMETDIGSAKAAGLAALQANRDSQGDHALIGVGHADQRRHHRPGAGRVLAVAVAVLVVGLVGVTVVHKGFSLTADQPYRASAAPAPHQIGMGAASGPGSSSGTTTLGPTRTVADRNGFRYGLRTGDLATRAHLDGQDAPAGMTFLGIDLEVTNLRSDRPVPLIPTVVTVAIPASMTVLDGEGSCRLGRATGRTTVPGYCLISLPPSGAGGSRDPLKAGETRDLTYSYPEAVPSNLDLSRARVYVGSDRLPH